MARPISNGSKKQYSVIAMKDSKKCPWPAVVNTVTCFLKPFPFSIYLQPNYIDIAIGWSYKLLEYYWNECINKPARSSCHGVQTSMGKEIDLVPPSKPQIEDPGCGLDGTSLTKDGITGDSFGNNSPSKEEEMQSTAHAELDEELSNGENLQLPALQPPPYGDKAEVDGRAATEGKRVDEEEGTDKDMASSLSGRQESITLKVTASSGPVKLNPALNCYENEMVSSRSSPSLDQHEILEKKDMLQQAQVVSFMDIKSSQSVQDSALLRTSTTDGGEILNSGDHFEQ